ncbi:phosphotransferase family protein [Nocardioides daphniae]|uniref:Acyl-CoA dehydrogenase n=1 Tax=Nocardioides daphniae TaxID=402297 RepID=A0ABQ1QEL5_9ACTN|nr:phosphotransferase family protein [Nocardioides daphniae]GGD23344.1 acyl-CoA dehydrogenase [Nocardioides daphniae]
MSDQLPGLDLDAFAAWFRGHRPDAGHDWAAELVAGGKSNLTYRVTDGTDRWIVRRPPLGHVQATAHDMGREFTVMSALAGTAVPVPGTIALCDDDSVLGAQFYVMELVEGTPFRDAEQLGALGEETTAHLCDAMVDVLAALHTVDPAEVGLDGFGRPEGFLARQVNRWGKQMAGSRTRELPDGDRLLAHLASHVPTDGGAPGIVHGDYRLDNLLAVPTDPQPVKAVVDWEMSTLGDPLTDLALLVVYDRVATMVPALGVSDASSAPGYPSPDALMTRYAAARGLDVDALTGAMEFHLGLAHYKLAAILEGIHHRFVAGQTVGGGFEHIGDAVEPLLAAGLRAATGKD